MSAKNLVIDIAPDNPPVPIVESNPYGDGWIKHKYHEIEGINRRYRDRAKIQGPKIRESWVVTPKLDGVPVVLYYQKDVLQACVTRGDGIYGQDVTQTVGTRVPNQLHNSFCGYIRCVVVISKENLSQNFAEEKSPRIVINDIITTSKPHTNHLEFLDVIPVGIYWEGSFMPDMEEFPEFVTVGSTMWIRITQHFRTNFKWTECNSETWRSQIHWATISELCEDYPCNGLVVHVHRGYQGMFAFDLSEKSAVTTVKKVTWATHGSGRIYPTVHYEPIRVGGCTATKASGKSYVYVVSKGVGLGALVEVTRSGNVLPNLSHVVRRGALETVRCQHGCNPEYLEELGAHLYCRDPMCPAYAKAVFERLINTFAPKFFSDAMRMAVMQTFGGNVFKMLQFYKGQKKIDNLGVGITGLTAHGEELVAQMLTNMMEWKIKLVQLAHIAAVEFFGAAQAKAIEKKAMSNKELTNWAVGTNIIDPSLILHYRRASISWTQRHPVIKELLNYFTLTVPLGKIRKRYKGYVCITGKLEAISKRRFAEEYIEPYGYKWVNVITDATILINAGVKTTSALRTARKRKIKVLSLPDWFKIVDRAVRVTDSQD